MYGSIQQQWKPYTYNWKKEVLDTLANEKGFIINEQKQTLRGPQVVWLQNGEILAVEDRVCFAIVLQRPNNRIINREEEIKEAEAQEWTTKCTIKRPIAPKQYVDSVVQCQVGDIIILEGDEELQLDSSTQPHGICFL